MNPGDFDGGSSCQYKGSACGECWSITGPGGSANIQVTDCCAGYPGHPSCLSSSDPTCDWCASNDNQHFDLDWNSYATVCGNQVNAGHCALSSATRIGCPSSAVADTTTTLSDSQSSATPTWAIAMIVLSSLMVVILLVLLVIIVVRRKSEERA